MTSTNELAAPVNQIQPPPVEVLNSLITKGDLSGLSPTQESEYYQYRCKQLGLDPFSQPFKILMLKGKRVMYPDRSCAQQLNKLYKVSHKLISKEVISDCFVVVAIATAIDGRFQESTGAVAIKGLTGEDLANAMMKAETKAKRRATLDLMGIGVPDDEEMETVRGVESTKKVVDFGESGQRVESRAAVNKEPLKATVVAPPAAEAPKPEVDSKNAELAKLLGWVTSVKMPPEFVLKIAHESQMAPDAKTLADIGEAQLKKLNSEPYRKQLLKVFAGEPKPAQEKTIEVEGKKEESKVSKEPLPPTPPKRDEGYQPDPEEQNSLRELYPNNPFKPDDIDLNEFRMHFPVANKGKRLDELDQPYLKGFYFRWKPKVWNGKISDDDFRLDAALVKWGIVNKIKP